MKLPKKSRDGVQVNKKEPSTRRPMKLPTDGIFLLPGIQEFACDDGTLKDREPRLPTEGFAVEAADEYPIPFVLEVLQDVVAILQSNYSASDWNDVAHLGAEIESELRRDEEVDMARLGECLIRLGIVYQRLTVRTAESDVRRGVKVVKGAQASHAQTHGTTEEKERRWSELTASFQELVGQGLRKTAAYRRVAKQFGCHPRTVERAVSRSTEATATEMN
ncbi:MAG: hypothetical protein WD049_05220 [Candidatus Paceibacterota bacterium]